NDIARIPETHLGTVFTMILKTGLQGFCPDLEGPVQSRYNQLHRHLAVSGFQFLSASFALCALDVNPKVAENTTLLCDMYDNYIYGTLAQKTKMERRRPGSLAQSIKNGVEYKGCARVGVPFFSPLPPKPRIRIDPLPPASQIGSILPPDVPVDSFTPEFFNALTLKERARYTNTGVAFPLKEFAFHEEHANWKKMGKKDFMFVYGNDVLAQYDIPSAEDIDALPKSDAEDDEEEAEIDLEDTDEEEGEGD
ncbi:hypothetical protein DFH07DRAFT_711478, partial [Mycena maculata]